MTTPDARYDEGGNLRFTFPNPLIHAPERQVFHLVLARNIPFGGLRFCARDRSWITVDWRFARRAEQLARTFWPSLAVRAAANPLYGTWSPEEHQPCGAAPVPSFGQRAAEIAGRR